MSDNLSVQDGQVVSMDYTLHVDGEVVDTSEGKSPLEFIQGVGAIIPGLEHELYGMSIGETKNVVVAPGDGYGDLDPDAFMDVPRDQFPADVPLNEGIELQVRDQGGQPAYARIDRVDDDTVRLDFNHPLAGKELIFDVQVVALREATDEERAHGHVHQGGGH